MTTRLSKLPRTFHCFSSVSHFSYTQARSHFILNHLHITAGRSVGLYCFFFTKRGFRIKHNPIHNSFPASKIYCFLQSRQLYRNSAAPLYFFFAPSSPPTTKIFRSSSRSYYLHDSSWQQSPPQTHWPNKHTLIIVSPIPCLLQQSRYVPRPLRNTLWH